VSAARASGPARRIVIAALGVTQILAWGSSYYLLAVLGRPIAADTGWSLSVVVGGLSVGLLAGSLASPTIGRTIDAKGGRPVLATSSLLLGLGLALLGSAHHLAVYVAAWLVLGIGMGGGLYDAAFATLGRAYGGEARSAIVSLTLWGGFASTVCWPLSAWLLETFGWRGACFAYAVVQLGFSLPVHLLLMPRLPAGAGPGKVSAAGATSSPRAQRRTFAMFAVLVTLGGAIASIMSVHLLTFLQMRGVELAAAVALGALFGPAQVASRVVEMTFGSRYPPIWTLAAAKGLIGASVVLLLAGIPVPLLGLAVMVYGAGNGVWSIARGTLPLALFGPDGNATLVGRLALFGLLAQALSPSLAAIVLDRYGPGSVLALLAAMAAVNISVTARLWLSLVRARRAREM
jgi:predicted MFS family arabinose efflux permease